MKKIIIALCITMAASAGLLVEPYTGYRLGGSDYKVGTNEFDFENTGAVLGARLGYTLPLLMAGIDLSSGKLSNDVDSICSSCTVNDNDKSDFTNTSIGIFAGVQLPILLRAWATYFVSADYKSEDGTDFEGSGYGLGVGFTGLPFVSLNIEYRALSFDDTENSNGGDVKSPEASQLVFSVSLPLDL